MLAAREGKIKCVIALVVAGASLTICDKLNYMTAIHYSAKGGYHECLQEIFKRGKGIEAIEMTDRWIITFFELFSDNVHYEIALDFLFFP